MRILPFLAVIFLSTQAHAGFLDILRAKLGLKQADSSPVAEEQIEEVAETGDIIENTEEPVDLSVSSEDADGDAAPEAVATDSEAKLESISEKDAIKAILKNSKVAKDEQKSDSVAKKNPIKVSKAYAFKTSKSQVNGAVFLTLDNQSDQEFRLMGASTEVADSIEIHSMSHVDGRMEMRKEPEVVIPASGTLELEPMGYHIMLIGLKEPLKKGETFPLRVIISGGHSVEIDVKIVTPGKKP